MSVRAGVEFQNNSEGTRKITTINLGWFSPSDYDITRLLIEAERDIDQYYNWDTLVYLGKKIDREKFNEMKRCFILSQGLTFEMRKKVAKIWSLEKAFNE